MSVDYAKCAEKAFAIGNKTAAYDFLSKVAIGGIGCDQFVPFGESCVHDGWRVDGNQVWFCALKRDAISVAKRLGWRAKDVTKVHTRFCVGWAICDGRFGLLRRSWVAERLLDQ